MARYYANNVYRTLTLHKDACHEVGGATVSVCGCGETSPQGNSQWFCEQHVAIDAVSHFMRGRFWAILLCSKCYGSE
jgi:hypothetical protein